MEEKLSEDYIITVDRVNKVFPNGVHALRNFSINVRRKEVLVVIGPSGSGKSTFLRCLNGLEDIDSGAIVVDGIPLNDRKKNRLEIRKEVGMVFQSFNLFPHLTVLDKSTWPRSWSAGRKAKKRQRRPRWRFFERSVYRRKPGPFLTTSAGASSNGSPLPGPWP
jgi:ABC-type polar amino acid transport system ATPase subunit